MPTPLPYVPMIRDLETIQQALCEVFNLVVTNQIAVKDASALLTMLQLAQRSFLRAERAR